MDPWKPQLHALGTFLRQQRQLANLSLRRTAELADISNAYLSQLERGLHQPSVRVLRTLADALDLSAETLLAHAGLLGDDEDEDQRSAERAIRADPRLTEGQRDALIAVYRSYVASSPAAAPPSGGPTSGPSGAA